MQPKRPWALFVHNNRELGGCEAYRMVIPADELGRQGYCCDYLHFEDVQKIAKREAASGHTGPGIGSYDLYVFPRFSVHVDAHTDLLRQAGKKLVFEVDDDFTNEHRQVLEEPGATILWDFVHQADAITVTTNYLADLMRKRVHKPTYVLPNSVRWEEWQVAKRARTTIGLTGSKTHTRDWQVLARVMGKVLKQHPEVDFLVAGYVPGWAWDLAYQYPEQVILDERWRYYNEYPVLSGSFHITLCPLEPADPFNWAKSPIKAVEAMASGSAVIATDTNVYRPALGHGTRGLLVKQEPEEWRAAIESLLDSSGLREKLTRKARAYARQHHAIDQTWSMWLRAYQEISHLR